MLLVLLATLISSQVVLSQDCPEKRMSGTFGSVSGGNKGVGTSFCNKEVFKLEFGRSMAVKLSWTYFNVGGDMPYCTDGNLKIEAG